MKIKYYYKKWFMLNLIFQNSFTLWNNTINVLELYIKLFPSRWIFCKIVRNLLFLNQDFQLRNIESQFGILNIRSVFCIIILIIDFLKFNWRINVDSANILFFILYENVIFYKVIYSKFVRTTVYISVC